MMETIIAAMCVVVAGGLFTVGYIVCIASNKLDSLFNFDVEYDDEIYVTDNEDEAKVRKHQELRLLEKKKAAVAFYDIGLWAEPLCFHEDFKINDKQQVVCGKCKRAIPMIFTIYGAGGGGSPCG